MQSIVLKGKVLDFKYIQNKHLKFVYNFYIGDIYVGQLFKIDEHRWAAVGNTSHKFNKIDGFGTRWKAAEFLLRLEGYSGN